MRFKPDNLKDCPEDKTFLNKKHISKISEIAHLN